MADKPCVRCSHAKADHGPSGEKDCMCGRCMFYVEPAPRWMRTATGVLGKKPREDDPGAMDGWCPGCDKVHTEDGRLCNACYTNPSKGPA